MKPVFGQRELFIAQSKIEADALRALRAIRQLGMGVARKCSKCGLEPCDGPDCGWPNEHLLLYDASLRGFGLEALNKALKIFIEELLAEPEEPQC